MIFMSLLRTASISFKSSAEAAAERSSANMIVNPDIFGMSDTKQLNKYRRQYTALRHTDMNVPEAGPDTLVHNSS
jgi:hypothetical protein